MRRAPKQLSEEHRAALAEASLERHARMTHDEHAAWRRALSLGQHRARHVKKEVFSERCEWCWNGRYE